MNKDNPSASTPLQFAIYWTVVGIPLIWGVWKTALTLRALFQ